MTGRRLSDARDLVLTIGLVVLVSHGPMLLGFVTMRLYPKLGWT